MGVASNLAFMLVFLAVGVSGRAVGLLTKPRRDRLNQAAFYVALPAVVFTSTYAAPLDKVVSVPLLVGLWAVLFGTAAIGWVVHRGLTAPPARIVAVTQSYHTNLGFLGLPVVAATFGSGHIITAKASILLGVGALTQNALTVTLFASGGNTSVSLRTQFRGFLTNPVIVALVAGLAFAAGGVGVPGRGLWLLNGLAEFALPVALLGVGSSLVLDVGDVNVPSVSAVVGTKTVAMPLFALGVFTVLGATATTVTAGVVMLSMPTAVSTYLYASELGGDAAFASLNVFLSTVVSLATLFVVLTAFS